MAKFKDLTGKIIGRWNVLYRDSNILYGHGTNKRTHIRWACRCQCGTLRTVLAAQLNRLIIRL